MILLPGQELTSSAPVLNSPGQTPPEAMRRTVNQHPGPNTKYCGSTYQKNVVFHDDSTRDLL
jgi:hypothetical protein